MELEALLALLPESYSLPDREFIARAYRVATRAHQGQERASGEPYITHCVAVAAILAEMHVPPAVIVAGLLHDVVEDTPLTLDDVRADFGDDVGQMVDAVTKLTTLPRVSRTNSLVADQKERQAREIAERRGLPDPDTQADARVRSRNYDLVSETLRKTFLAMAEDPRVVLIKLADRLHNMRTLNHVPPHKQARVARETMDIFAPLASRLGIWQMKWELEDWAFKYVNPEKYREIAAKLDHRLSEREAQLEQIKRRLGNVLAQAGIVADISGRPKHIYSIYRKMDRKGVPFELVRDIRGVRILVPDKEDCYAALGVIHSHWRPIPGEFDDYIAAPKDNFYQSLHTAVVYDDGKTLEVQLRTEEMHERAEYGIAAHWRYKEGARHDPSFERGVNYLRQLMEWRQDVEDAQEFVAGMKSDVFGDRVYVFTPRGDIIDLPAGATPIDFAYHVHTEIGHRCRGAKVAGKLVSLDYTLKTGDQIEILTAKRGGPSRDWLNTHLGLVRTQRARSKIRRWFKRQARDQNISHGKSLLERELRQLGLTGVNLEQLARQFEYKTVDDFSEALGCGDIALGKVVNELVFSDEDPQELADLQASLPLERKETTSDVTVLGLKGLLTNMARCCNPTPGDDIVGYVTRGRGATIHRQDCPNVLRIRDRERLVKVSWGSPASTFPVPVRVKAYDRDGLMRDVSTLIADEGINMAKVSVNVNVHGQAVFDLILEVRDVEHLSRVLDRLEGLSNVYEARRVRPG
ncbi:MAG: bifunctional (p)ppGpp synthetase/guanosine-3',5'-bis(diphosphate) 3'-pyrophosphohydrolase [Anaerolineales bacterium]|nr:bifunctional (p)ppGpp synthetase/guanosine-3',5'-bis(diphosphate) 3'-pyrophosphohydrolase [Anaerolineales bacterium]